MIYTVTLNPAIDYVMRLESFDLGITNRSASEELYFGGKGVNVSNVLAELGVESTAWGFCAGFTGAAIVQSLEESGIAADFIELAQGASRINVKLKPASDASPITETEINGQGPAIPDSCVEALLRKAEGLTAHDVLVLSGSIPSTSPDDLYERMLLRTADADVPAVVDATGDLLMRCLAFRPLLVKPNQDEMAAMLGCDSDSADSLVSGAHELQRRGARNVIVSCGGRGSILIDESGCATQSPALQGTLVNSVGAGDSMVAGFLAGWLKAAAEGLDAPCRAQVAYRLAQACGAATAFSPGLAQRETIERLLVEQLQA